MYNITLICTRHEELGKCNSSELYKIIESINPEIIFEEIPPSYFEKYYITKSHKNLESDVINKYLEVYNVKIFPVDIDVRQKLSKYQDEIFFMFLTFFNYEDYKKLDNEKETLIAQEGFHYLNSDKFLDFLEKKEVMEKNIMESEIEKNRLLDIYKLFHAEQYDSRENAMLQNIYNYSKGNQYNQAVFLIGAEHRKSIMQKIQEYEIKEEFKLNWKFYNG
ncbi:MAG: hypothetical protein E6H07_11225 [Bacteroidetes bacterium]|nr:MAG: hypothetical protein E6H07_11225 [Bacteroidota bacterium]